MERRNGGQSAEASSDATPDGMQSFLSRTRSAADAVRDGLQAYAAAHLGDDDAVLVRNETGFLKTSTERMGVQQQYAGMAGRIEKD